MKQLAIFFIAISLNFFASQAQTPLSQTVRGTVLDEMTGYPLIGARVILSNTKPLIGVSTDVNGIFSLTNVALGRQTLEISFIGYQPKYIPNLLVIAGKELVIEVQMVENVTQIDEIVVSSTIQKELPLNEMALISARTFSIEETERFAGSLGDPARMVANYAGVMTQNDSRNDIIIRGNSPIGVIWRMEGIEIANPNHFAANGTTGGPVSMVNNNLLSNSDFLTGAFPAEYGNGIAGAFDLNLRSGNNQKNEFVGQVGFNGFEFGAEGPLAQKSNGVNPSYVANFRYSTLEVMDKLGFDVGTGTAVPEYKDLTFLVDVPGTKSGRYKIFGLYGDSKIRLGRDYADSTANSYSTKGTATDFASKLAVTGLTNTYYFNEKEKISSSLSAQYTNATTVFDSIKGGTTLVPYYRGTQNEVKLSFSSRYSKKINARNTTNVGLILDQYHINFIDSTYKRSQNQFITISDFQGNVAMVRFYGEWQHKFNDKLTGYVGLHSQFFNLNKEVALEPRLSLKWSFKPHQSFSFGYGKHSQMQPKAIYVFETQIENENRTIRTNENVKFTKSNHFVIGYDHLFSDRFRLKAEAYYQNLFNAPVKASFEEFSMLNAGTEFSTPREDSLINTGKGRNKGIELTLERFLSNGYYFLFTSSLFNSEYTGYDGIWRNTQFNGNYVFNLLGGYEFKVGAYNWLTCDAKTVYAGGNRFVPIDLEQSKLSQSEVRDWSHAYENKYDDYFKINVRVGYKISKKKWTQEWALDLQNITNYKSLFMEGYDVDEEEIYYVYQQGFLPMFLYRIQF